MSDYSRIFRESVNRSFARETYVFANQIRMGMIGTVRGVERDVQRELAEGMNGVRRDMGVPEQRFPHDRNFPRGGYSERPLPGGDTQIRVGDRTYTERRNTPAASAVTSPQPAPTTQMPESAVSYPVKEQGPIESRPLAAAPSVPPVAPPQAAPQAARPVPAATPVHLATQQQQAYLKILGGYQGPLDGKAESVEGALRKFSAEQGIPMKDGQPDMNAINTKLLADIKSSDKVKAFMDKTRNDITSGKFAKEDVQSLQWVLKEQQQSAMPLSLKDGMMDGKPGKETKGLAAKPFEYKAGGALSTSPAIAQGITAEKLGMSDKDFLALQGEQTAWQRGRSSGGEHPKQSPLIHKMHEVIALRNQLGMEDKEFAGLMKRQSAWSNAVDAGQMPSLSPVALARTQAGLSTFGEEGVARTVTTMADRQTEFGTQESARVLTLPDTGEKRAYTDLKQAAAPIVPGLG